MSDISKLPLLSLAIKNSSSACLVSTHTLKPLLQNHLAERFDICFIALANFPLPVLLNWMPDWLKILCDHFRPESVFSRFSDDNA